MARKTKYKQGIYPWVNAPDCIFACSVHVNAGEFSQRREDFNSIPDAINWLKIEYPFFTECASFRFPEISGGYMITVNGIQGVSKAVKYMGSILVVGPSPECLIIGIAISTQKTHQKLLFENFF